MNVIDMPHEVGFIANRVLPKTVLPESALVPQDSSRRHPFWPMETCRTMLADSPFNDLLAG
jgi:hypothetical protein